MARGDPIDRLKRHLISVGSWSDEKQESMEARIDEEVMQAYKEAVKYGDLAEGPYPSSDTIFTEVYSEVPWHLREQWDEMNRLRGD